MLETMQIRMSSIQETMQMKMHQLQMLETMHINMYHL